MRLTILVKPKKKQALVEVLDQEHLVVSVKEPPIDGRANAGVIMALSRYFRVSPNEIDIISGHTSRIKVVSVPDGSMVKPAQKVQTNLL